MVGELGGEATGRRLKSGYVAGLQAVADAGLDR